ncbi:AAA family ATPase [Turicibacter sanguinis]|uniref:AAA family ATPase n=1 Tax=Turicibacter sanguinis TaxID=154288 RepID=UPI00325BB0F0
MHQQVILFGSPGTGKSFSVKKKLEKVSSDKIFRVTIHPEFQYTDFIGQILPNTTPGGRTTFTFKEGPFTQALMEAYVDSNKAVYLVLEELSRGNVAAIFGDIFQLLDRDEHFISKYPIRNENIAKKITVLTTDEIVLPSNFNIICTVNMNDQNVFPMDTAFKRRFDWEYVSTDPAVDENGNRYSKLNNPNLNIAISSDRSEDLKVTWQSFYMILNRFITSKEKGLGKKEDKQVGQFFIDFGRKLTEKSHSTNPKDIESANKEINIIIKNKLLNYLWYDVQGTSSFKNSVSLFDENISSYDDLYKKMGTEKIFSDVFINEFLKPNISLYPYEEKKA